MFKRRLKLTCLVELCLRSFFLLGYIIIELIVLYKKINS
jgi:hypothetical protein